MITEFLLFASLLYKLVTHLLLGMILGLLLRIYGTKHSRMDQIKFICLPQISLGPFLNTLSDIKWLGIFVECQIAIIEKNQNP